MFNFIKNNVLRGAAIGGSLTLVAAVALLIGAAVFGTSGTILVSFVLVGAAIGALLAIV